MSNKTRGRSYKRPKRSRAQRIRRRARASHREQVRETHDAEKFEQEQAELQELRNQENKKRQEAYKKLQAKQEASATFDFLDNIFGADFGKDTDPEIVSAFHKVLGKHMLEREILKELKEEEE